MPRDHRYSSAGQNIHYDYSTRPDGNIINVEIEIPILGEFEIVSFPFDVAVEDPRETATDLCSAYEVGLEQVAEIEAILVQIRQTVRMESSNGQRQPDWPAGSGEELAPSPAHAVAQPALNMQSVPGFQQQSARQDANVVGGAERLAQPEAAAADVAHASAAEVLALAGLAQ